LRELGYRTFDHALDNSYDQETNNTERWRKILKLITDLKQQDLHQWFLSCLDDIEHNQQLFASSKANRLNNLLERLK
jgi:Trp operon repressor